MFNVSYRKETYEKEIEHERKARPWSDHIADWKLYPMRTVSLSFFDLTRK